MLLLYIVASGILQFSRQEGNSSEAIGFIGSGGINCRNAGLVCLRLGGGKGDGSPTLIVVFARSRRSTFAGRVLHTIPQLPDLLVQVYYLRPVNPECFNRASVRHPVFT